MKYEKIEEDINLLRDCLIDCATGGGRGKEEERKYAIARKKVLLSANSNSDKELKNRLPNFVSKYSTLNAFWSFIQPEFGHYRDRRAYIYDGFAPICQYIEDKIYSTEPQTLDFKINEILSTEYIETIKEKAMIRLAGKDYDGAITLASTLINAVEKELYRNISGQALVEDWDTNVLHNYIMKSLNMDASKDYDKRLKKIISGLFSICDGIANIRNVASDAHSKKYSATFHHAQLAINSAFTLCQFLLASYKYQKGQGSA